MPCFFAYACVFGVNQVYEHRLLPNKSKCKRKFFLFCFFLWKNTQPCTQNEVEEIRSLRECEKRNAQIALKYDSFDVTAAMLKV